MNLAFIDQPISRVVLPEDDQPFRGGSISLWGYHISRHCAAAEHNVYAYSRQYNDVRLSKDIEGVHYEIMSDMGDERRISIDKRLKPIKNLFGLGKNPRKPYYFAPWFYRNFALQVAKHLQETKCDIAQITNFPHLIPILREYNPTTKIILHMQCEWVKQMEESLIRPGLDQCDMITGCSQWVIDKIVERFPEYQNKSFNLHNGVDTDYFVPTDDLSEVSDSEIVFIGRVSPERGAHTLLEAFNLVLEEVPNAKLKMIGSYNSVPREYLVDVTDDPLMHEMRKYYKEGSNLYYDYAKSIPTPQANERITWISDLPQVELLKQYQQAAIFTFPSLIEEPFGMPIIEAMACGKPVISTDGGGIPEFLHDGENGLLVPRNDPQALAQAFIKLLNEPQTRDGMGKKGRDLVASDFSWKQIAKNYLNLIENHL